MYDIFGLDPSIWAQVEAVGFIIIVVCCVCIAIGIYSISIKLTEVMKDVIDIDSDKDSNTTPDLS